jgi:Ca-activated chloride channel family protein
MDPRQAEGVMHFQFALPHLLYLLLLLPVWWLLVWPRVGGGVLFTRGESARRLAGWWGAPSAVVLTLPRFLRSATMACLVIALAQPQRIEILQESTVQGRGIGLAIDLSSSMLSVDATGAGNRLDVARKAAIRFAKGRPHDEMSLVAFAGQASTRVPPTMDSNLIVRGIESLEVQLLRDGTDISAGVLTAIARLLESDRKPRVIILLTDGAHNGSGVAPLAAARAAATLGIRVHTISILGPRDAQAAAVAPREKGPSKDMATVLTGIAGLTGGKYFSASSAAALDSIYRQINRIETPVVEAKTREIRHDERVWPLMAAFLLLALEVLFRGSRWGIVP